MADIIDVNIGDQVLEVYWQDEVELNLDMALMYIKSGQKEIQDYVDNVSKPEIDNYVETEAKPIVAEVVNTIAEPLVNEYIETETKPSIDEYVDGLKPDLQAYVTQAQGFASNSQISAEASATSAAAAENALTTLTTTATDNFNANAESKTNAFNTNATDKQAQVDASANAAKESETNAAESAGLAANSAAAAKVSENNAKASETNVDNKTAEVEAIAKLASFGNIGDIKYTSRTDVPNGGAWCNGALYTKAQFPDVYQMLVDGKLQSTTVGEFDSSVSANGSCGFFGLDTTNERFKVPMLKDVYLKAGQVPSMFGAESLPNIKGNSGSGSNVHNSGDRTPPSGAFAKGSSNGPVGGGSEVKLYNTSFNASRSSSTYKDNAKVNPDHVVYRAYVVLYSKVLDVPASVDKALIWAEGTDAQVQALGGEKSAKGWAEASTNLNYTNITNCITEIPQDIKLELNNGMLTLKAGSKVYVPNGKDSNGKDIFKETILTSDLVISTGFNSKTVALFYNGHGRMSLDRISSGSTAPSNPANDNVWYDTSTNKIKTYKTDQAAWIEQTNCSLPIGIAKANDTGTGFTSIDQIFNGFGYIGSTVFALPGVKGLIPDGRNADGSLKNIEYVNDKVRTFTATESGYGLTYFLNPETTNLSIINTKAYAEKDTKLTTFDNNNGIWFDTESNKMFSTTDSGTTWTQVYLLTFGSIYMTNVGHLDYLKTKTVFHALDYNDKSTISGWSMPSNRYIDLTLGASGSTYTAPANGYIAVGIDGVTNNWITFEAGNSYFQTTFTSPNKDTTWVRGTYAIGKGHHVKVYYGGTSSSFPKYIVFYYAEGEAN